MQYRKLGKTGLEVSAISIGLWAKTSRQVANNVTAVDRESTQDEMAWLMQMFE